MNGKIAILAGLAALVWYAKRRPVASAQADASTAPADEMIAQTDHPSIANTTQQIGVARFNAAFKGTAPPVTPVAAAKQLIAQKVAAYTGAASTTFPYGNPGVDSPATIRANIATYSAKLGDLL